MKKYILITLLLIGLCACTTKEKAEIKPLVYKEMDYDIDKIATIKYEPKKTDVIVESIVDDTIYGSVVNFQKNEVTFVTEEMFSLTNGKLDIIKGTRDERWYDQIRIDDELYYLTFVVTETVQYSELYQYIDGTNDILIQKMECSRTLTPPRFIKYHSSFLVLNAGPKTFSVYEFDKKNHKLNEFDTLIQGDNTIVSTAQLLNDDLYINVAKGESNNLYKIDLLNKEVQTITEADKFKHFVVTKDYIVLYVWEEEDIYGNALEEIYDKDFQLLRTGKLDTSRATWVAYVKENEAVYVGENKSIYYRTYENNECLKLDAEREPIISDFPVKIFVKDDAVIADNFRGVIYKVKMKNIK